MICFGIFWWIHHERESAKNEIKIENLEKENKTQGGIIETKNDQQKLISKPDLDSDLTFRDKWLQLVWEKSDNIN